MNTEEDFKREFRELLRKYNVEMSVEDYNNGNPEINFYRCPEYDMDGNEVLELINFNTRWENGDSE